LVLSREGGGEGDGLPNTAVQAAALTALFFCAAGLSLFDTVSVDLGWHLAAGELVWKTRSLPSHDVFSYLAEGRDWLDSQWLFQLGVYAVHALAGAPGLVLLRLAIVTTTFALLLATGFRRERLALSLGLTLLALFTSYQRFVMRPELLSVLFLAALFYAAEHAERRPRAYAIGVFLCQVVWTNLHGLHLLGPIFLGLYCLGAHLDGRRYGAPEGSLHARGRLLLASLLGLVANANGVEGILYPLLLLQELRGEVAWFPQLAELGPPFSLPRAETPFPHPVAVYKVFLLLSIASWVANLKRIRLAHALPFAAFLWLSLLATRNLPLFAIVAAPVTLRNLNDLLDAHTTPASAAGQAWRRISCVLLLALPAVAIGVAYGVLGNGLYDRLNWKREFGVGESRHLPWSVLEPLRELEGNLFNSPDLGGFLLWNLRPGRQVAVDGRWELYGESIGRIHQAYRRPEVFAELARRHRITAVVLSTGSAHTRFMRPWLERSRDWHLTLATRNAVLFERVADPSTRVPRPASHAERADTLTR
jgi:hypothetical protein